MTLAELLRRSAEYARRSVEELARALHPPGRHAAPSFEPAYAPRGSRNFRPRAGGGGAGRRFFHWSSRCESRMRHRRIPLFHRMGRRHGRFFGANHTRVHECRAHKAFLFKLIYKAYNATKMTLACAVRPSLWPRGDRPTVLPNLFLRAGATSLKLCAPCKDMWQFRYGAVYGHRVSPTDSPYEVMKQAVFARKEMSRAEMSLLRYQDQFRSTKAVGIEIREKLRGLAVYQQSVSDFLFPRAVSALDQSTAATAAGYPSRPPDSYAEFPASDNGSEESELLASEQASDYSETSVLSAAIDFNIAPRLTLPVVGELNEDMLDSVRSAINSQIANLRAVITDIDRIAELGELPISIEQNGSVLRVHLPNCDASRANVLVDDKEVTNGRTVEIIAPRIRVPGTSPLSTESLSEFDMLDSVSEASSDEVWQHVRDDTPGLTSMESSQSPSSPSLLTLN